MAPKVPSALGLDDSRGGDTNDLFPPNNDFSFPSRQRPAAVNVVLVAVGWFQDGWMDRSTRPSPGLLIVRVLALVWPLALHLTCALPPPNPPLHAPGASSSRNESAAANAFSSNPPHRSSFLLLDVDNTLYDETTAKIERQIIQNIHETVGDPEWADHLHTKYGSTIAGLDRTIWNVGNTTTTTTRPGTTADSGDNDDHHGDEGGGRMKQHQDYYDRVYRDLDYTSLLRGAGLPRSSKRDSSSSAEELKTGYDHHHGSTGSGIVDPHVLRVQLQKVSRMMTAASVPSDKGRLLRQLYLASNSPRHHVEKVIQALGMTRVPWSGLITPHPSNAYATKLDGAAFFVATPDDDRLGQVFRDDEDTMMMRNASTTNAAAALIDDSRRNLQCFPSLATYHCNNTDPHASIHIALGRALGWIDPCFAFDDVAYLQAKNQVDRVSIHAGTWDRLRMELADLSRSRLTIVDVGAGLLSMLDLSLHGSDRLAPLWSPEEITMVDYYAYEPNRNLEGLITARLDGWGFRRVNDSFPDDESSSSSVPLHHIYRRGNCTVHVCFESFENAHGPQPSPDLIIGCCFADLHDPYQLIPSLMAQYLVGHHRDATSTTHSGTLLYFPITFCGVTQFTPPRPFQDRIPSDTLAFQLYSEALQDMDHHLDPRALQSAVEDYGGHLVAQGASPWSIKPDSDNGVLWDTMLYFFGTVGAPKLNALSWNARGWLDRARRLRPIIHVSNVDLLFRLPRLGEWSFREEAPAAPAPEESRHSVFEEILFTGPREVTVVERPWKALESDELRIRSEYSLISTGTELKVFTGQFDDAPLDVSIESMKDSRLQYPLAYGYSMVGIVVECGSGLDRTEWVGQRVFCFTAHASQAIAKASSVQLIPNDCTSLDAIFMPSVETALSLVQEARPVLGENIGVIGQGLIGLLVTALLRHFRIEGSHSFGVVTTYDALWDRVMLSSKMDAGQALLPTTSTGQAFDVAIEVSGNGKALQAAIDATRPGGRIVIGSWYGYQDVPLRLGMDFHRSHKMLLASQVSCIPVSLSATWDKARRFQLAWELTKKLEPSRLLSGLLKLRDAPCAYALLEAGSAIALAFQY